MCIRDSSSSAQTVQNKERSAFAFLSLFLVSDPELKSKKLSLLVSVDSEFVASKNPNPLACHPKTKLRKAMKIYRKKL